MKAILLLLVLVLGNSFFWGAKGQAPIWNWGRSAAGLGSGTGYSVATDNNGYAYVLGSYAGSSINFGSVTLTNAGGNDIFLVKYDSSGVVVWAKGIGGTGDDIGYGVATDKNGNVFITGNFTSASLSFGVATLNSPGFFLAKFSPNGTSLWAKDAGGNVYHIGGPFGSSTCIATDTTGNVCVTGAFLTSLTFGSTTLSNTGNADVFVVKYDANGIPLWAKSGIGGAGDSNTGGGVATDASGAIYITGYAGASTVFGSYMTGIAGLYVVKYNSSGTVQWVAVTAGGGGGVGSGITVANGMVYVVGWFTGSTIAFGPYSATNASAGHSDILMAPFYASNGNTAGVWNAGGPDDDEAYGICSDKSGNLYISGMFKSSSITFPVSTTITNGNAPGFPSPFVAKFPLAFNFASWAKTANSYQSSANSIACDSNGLNIFVAGKYYTTAVFDYDTLLSSSSNEFTSLLRCPPFRPTSITGNTTVCEGSIQTFSISPVSSASDYVWNLPPGWTGNSTSTTISVLVGSSGGTISVAANNGCGTSAPSSLQVTVNPVPPVPTISHVNYVLGSSSSTGNQWFRNDTLIPAATSQLYPIPQPILFYQCFRVVVTNTFGCSSRSDTTCFSAQPNSVNSLSNSSEVAVYPNPSNGTVNLSAVRNIEEVQVFDIYGQTLIRMLPNCRQVSLIIDVPGLYILSLTIDRKRRTEKLIIQR